MNWKRILYILFVGIVAVMAFVMVSAGILFAIIKATMGLRVAPQGEQFGLDIYEHGLITYPEFTNNFSLPTAPTPGSPHAEGTKVKPSPAAGD